LTELASRRRRRKSIGKVVTDVERRVRRVEKRPGATRLKRNVVTGEKIQYRAIPTKAIQANAITANEAEFGVPIVSDTEPTDYLKAGTLWFDTTSNSASVYDITNDQFLPVTDTVAIAAANGKNSIYRQTTQPTGASYVTGDTWFDSDDGNKIYRFDGSAWVAVQLGGNGLANINANSINTGTLNANVVTISNLDAGSIATGTLTAITIQQGSSGTYILMDQTNKATIKFNVTGFTNPGFISVESSFSGTLGWLSLQAPTTGSETNVASIDLTPENMYLSAGYIDISSAGNFSLGNSPGGIQIKDDITTTPAGDAPDAGLNRFIKSVRNIWQSPNSYTPSGGDGAEGDVWLTY
jgi:hypothetical protein